MLLGNKCDREDRRQVTVNEARQVICTFKIKII